MTDGDCDRGVRIFFSIALAILILAISISWIAFAIKEITLSSIVIVLVLAISIFIISMWVTRPNKEPELDDVDKEWIDYKIKRRLGW